MLQLPQELSGLTWCFDLTGLFGNAINRDIEIVLHMVK